MPCFYPSHSIILITQPHALIAYFYSKHGSHEGIVQRDNRGDYFTRTGLQTTGFCGTKPRATIKTTTKKQNLHFSTFKRKTNDINLFENT